MLLLIFSKLCHFIQYNLVENKKSLPNKENYILVLLNETDLRSHPVWKQFLLKKDEYCAVI